MSFKMKYSIKNDLLPKGTKRRPGTKLNKVRFIVDHDTGNPNSTAQGNVNYYRSSANSQYASAQVFIDDKEIIICIPVNEKAYHVIYNVTTDNKKYGVDANDAAIGIELCYFPNDRARTVKAYEKYVWYNAYLAYQYGLNISKDFVGHHQLDPGRKTDPMNAFNLIGKSFAQFLKDVQAEYDECTSNAVVASNPEDKGYLIYNDRGDRVKAMQEYLTQVGYPAEATGYFNAATKRALMNFQEARGIEADGVYGAGSLAEMNKALKELKAPKSPTTPKKEGVRMFKPSKAVLSRELGELLVKAKEDGIVSSDEWKEALDKGELPLDDAVGLIASYLNRTHK